MVVTDLTEVLDQRILQRHQEIVGARGAVMLLRGLAIASRYWCARRAPFAHRQQRLPHCWRCARTAPPPLLRLPQRRPAPSAASAAYSSSSSPTAILWPLPNHVFRGDTVSHYRERIESDKRGGV